MHSKAPRCRERLVDLAARTTDSGEMVPREQSVELDWGGGLPPHVAGLFERAYFTQMTAIFGDHQHNFEAEITIFPLGPTTRSSHPFNGIRWDFCYVEDLRPDGSVYEVNMIYPEFVDENGHAVADDIPLEGSYRARMHIVFGESIAYHRNRLTVGTKFYCTEGARKVAEGIVTSLSPMNPAEG